MSTFSQDQQALADALMRVEAIMFGQFRLKLHETQPNAPLSPIYLNLRTPDNPKQGPLTGNELDLIARCWMQIMEEQGIHADLLAGIPNAASPMAMALWSKTGIDRIDLVKSFVEGRRWISGIQRSSLIEPDRQVLLIDDVITGADTKLEAVGVLRSLHMKVPHLLVVVDRMQGGIHALNEFNVQTHAIFQLDELLDYYVATSQMTMHVRDEVMAYISSQ